MKKVFSAITVCSMAAVVLTGCGADSKIVGSWHNDDIGGDFTFDKDGKLSLSVDYSELGMNFTDDKKFAFSGVEVEPKYDGTNLSVALGEDYGLDEEMVLMEMERTGKADEDSFDGEYKLTGGMLYDELGSLLEGNSFSETYMIVDGEALSVKIDLCEYKADGKVLELTGDGVQIFNFENDEEAKCDYTIEDDVLTLKDGNGEEISFEKVTKD